MHTPLLTSDPEIHFERNIVLQLQNGNHIRFAIYGNTKIKGSIKPGELISTDQLNVYMETEDSPFFIAAYDAIKEQDTKGIDFDIPESNAKKISCHDLLRKKDLEELARIVIPAKDQYDFLVKFMEAQPDIRGWLFKDNVITGNTYSQENHAQDDIKGDDNAVVVNKDGKFSSKHLGIDDMANLAEELRRKQNDKKYYSDQDIIKEGESISTIKYNGKNISEEELSHMFYKSIDDALVSKEGTEKLNVLVYRMEGNYFGEVQLTKEKARDTWIKLDTNTDAGSINTWDVRNKLGAAVDGTFELLIAEGTYRAHNIDVNYYLGRDFFIKHKDQLNRSLDPDTEDKKTEGHYELVNKLEGGENMRLYVRGEMDRPSEDAVAFRAILNKEGGNTTFFAQSFQYEMGKKVYEEDVKKYAQDYAYEIVANVGTFLYNLGENRSMLESQLFQLPTLDAGNRRGILSTFGYTEDALDELVVLFSDNEKTLQITLGVEVEGYTFDGITERIKETGLETGNFAEKILHDEVDALTLEGELGNQVRKYAYDKAGFHNLDPAKFPHSDEATSEYTPQTAHQFSSTREQLFAYYAYKTDLWKKWTITALIIIVMVVITLVSFGIGAFVAGALGLSVTLGSAIATTVINGIIISAIAGVTFTIIAEGLAQAMGGGDLNRDKDWYGLGDLFTSMFANVLLFAVTGAFSSVLGGLGVGAVFQMGILGSAFFAYSYYQFYREHDRGPQGQELYDLIYENILGLALFEIGGRMAKGFIGKMLSKGQGMYGDRMTRRFTSNQEKIIELQKQLAAIVTAEKNDPAAQYELLKDYRNQLKVMDDILATYEKGTKTGKWQLTDKDGNQLSQKDIAAKRLELGEQIAKLDAAEFAYKTGVKQVLGRQDAILYKGDKESIKLLKEKHKKQGDTVTEDNGIITVIKPNGEKVVYLPEKPAEFDLQKELLSKPELAGNIRQTNANAMSVSASKLTELQSFFGKGWKSLGNDLYVGEMVRDGKTAKIYFVTEESVNISESAIKAEASQPGTGMEVLRSSLRSVQAADGLKDFLRNECKGLTIEEQLQKLKGLEENAKKDGKSLNETLEMRGKKLAVTLEEDSGAVYAYDTNGSRVGEGYMDSDSNLNLKIETKGSETRGEIVFREIFNYINNNPNFMKIEGIKALWLEGRLGDNFNTFYQKRYIEKLSEEEAAKSTFTGKMASQYGFSKVERVVVANKKNGDPYMITVYFKKP